MANHYSGKRAAGRKPVGKRALSLLMALVMSLSLVQITAFAVETDQSKQVTNPGDTVYYKADGTEGSENDWAVKLSRTLTETSTENLFNVDLEVTTKDNTVSTDAEAVTVLVIDTSGSMGYCAVCGQKGQGEGKNHGATGYQWVYECDSKPGSYWADEDRNDVCDNCGKEAYEWDWFWGWVSTHTEKRIPVGAHPFQSRLTAAKKVAKDFLDNYAKNASGSTSTKPRYVAVVEYAKTATTVQAMVDVTNEQSRNAAKRVIDGLEAGGGTNTEAGLQLASNLLDTIKGIDNKFVVLLTDGKPTYYIDTDERVDRNGTEEVPTGYRTWGGYDDGVKGNGSDTTSVETGAVETVSTALVTAGVHVYGVTYGLTKQDGTMETVPNGSGKDTPIDTWMKDDCKMDGAFSADSTDALNAAFKTIINTIQHETVGTTVVTAVNNEVGEGALTDLYSFVKFNGDANGAAANNNQVTWDLSKATPEAGTADNEKTYHLSYQVWMGTETQDFEEETPYSLGAATLSFKVNDGESKSVAFPYVAAKGYLGELDFTKVKRVDNEFAPLAGAEFELTVAEGSTFGHTKPLEGTSNDNGAVAISGIPSGYTYTLSETKAPEGYVQTDKTWTVTVSYGEVTVVENTESDEGAPVDLNRFQIVNEKIPPADASYQVVHAYYNGETLVHATEPVTVSAKEGDVVTSIQQEPVYDGVTYTFKSMDKVLPWTLEAGDNGVVTLRYEYEEKIPEDASYQVVHAYYENGTLVHETEPVTVSAKEGDVVTSIQQEPVYNGVTYSFTSMDKTLPWTLEAGNNGTVTLRYDRTYNPPVGPSYTYYTVTVNYYDKDSGEVIHTAYTTTQREYTAYDVTAQDKIAITGYTYVETTGDALTGTLNGNKVINVYYTKDSSIDDGNTPTDPGTDIGDDDVPVTPAKPPKTGDSMGLWIAAAMVSGMGLIWLFLSGKKRKEEI